MTPRAPLMIVLIACTPVTDKAPADTSPPLDTGPEAGELKVWGEAPWDPLAVILGYDRVHEPLVHDAARELVPVEAVFWYDRAIAYTPVSDLEAGDYTVVGWDGIDEGWTDLSFTVTPYGRDAAFSPDAVLGRVYEVDLKQLWVAVPAGIGEHARDELDAEERIYLRVTRPDSAEGTAVQLDLVAETRETGARCVLLRDTATLTETGDLSWSLEEVTVETETLDVQSWDLAIHLGWLADGSAGGGLEARATVDTREMGPVLSLGDDPFSVCDMLGGPGAFCRRCPSDGLTTCTDVWAYAGTLSPVDVTLEDDLPMCGLDVESGLPSFSCDMPDIELDCGCHAPLTRGAALPVSLSLLAFLRRRRGPARRRAANPPSS